MPAAPSLTAAPRMFRSLRHLGHVLAWRPRGMRQWLLLNIAVGIAYWLFAQLGAAVAIGPAGLSVLWPPNGLALACVLAWGVRVMPGLLVGALVPESMLALTQGLDAWQALGVSVVVRLGSAAQWWAMALFLQDWRQLLRRPQSGFTRRFALGTLVFCTLAPSIGITVLVLVGRIPVQEALTGWLSWWVGDVSGMLVLTPLLMAALHPFVRRNVVRSQTFPMLSLGLGLTLSGTALLGHLDTQARLDRANAQLRDFSQSLRSQLELAESDLGMLAALHYDTRLELDQFEASARELRATHAWVHGFAYLRALPHAEREALEERLQQNLRAVGPDGELQNAADRESYWAVERLAPLAGQEARLGVDEASDPLRREAIEDALRSGRTSITPVLDNPLFAAGSEWGVLLYRPVFEAGPPGLRPTRATGLVSATVTLRPLVQAALRERPPFEFPMLLASGGERGRALLLEGGRLRELGQASAKAWLSGRSDRDPAATPLQFGSRQWQLHSRVDTGVSRFTPSLAQWAAAAIGLGSTGLLTALLVARSRRDEVLRQWRVDLSRQVAERTADLSALNHELRLNAQQLGEREALLSSLLRAIPDPVWMKDRAGRYLIVNPAFAEDMGLPAEQIIGRRMQDLVNAEEADAIEAADRHALTQSAPVMEEQRSRRPDGSERLLMQLRVVVRDAQDRPLGLLRLAWDITEQRRHELDLAQARDRAEDANRAKSTFLSNISHEIRTPLNAVLGFGQLLGEDDTLSVAARAQVESIQRAGKRLLRLINDVLDLSKIEAGALQLAEEPVELHAELAEVVQLLQARAQQQQVGLVLQRDFEPPLTALLDRGKFGQVLINLLGNALKFSPPGTSVRVHALLAGPDQLLLHVEDQGPGISADELSRLFQPFQQGEAGARHGGTGLGLVLSRRLIEAMGGELGLDSVPGQGTRAHIRLPLRRAQAIPLGQEPEFAGTGWHLTPEGRCRVLVAEDDEDSRALLVGLLRRVGCEVQAGEDGAAALALARAQEFDIVLSDMRMPNLDGPGLLRALQDDPRSRSWPVIAVTASSLLLTRDEFMAMGFAEHIPKPYAVAEVLRVLQQLGGARFVQASAAPTAPAADASEPRSAAASVDLHAALTLAREGRALELRQWLAAAVALPPALRRPLTDALARYDLQAAETLLQDALSQSDPDAREPADR